MAKKETQPQIEAKPEPQYPSKFYQDICCDICEITMDIEIEIEVLQRNLHDLLSYYFKNEFPYLLEFRNSLEETRNHLSRQNLSLAWGSRLNKILYGDDQFK